MKAKDVRSISTLIKEYGMTPGPPTPVSQQKSGALAKQIDSQRKQKSIVNKQSPSPTTGKQIKVNPQVAQPVTKKFGNQLKKNDVIRDVKTGAPLGMVVSPIGQGQVKDKVIVQDAGGNIVALNPQTEYTVDMYEGSLLKKRNTLKGRIKKLSRKRLKEAKPELFEINFNRREVATSALDAPVKCGFEAESFFYNVDEYGPSDDVDNMSVSDVEYEFGDLPDSAYSDYQDWLMEKAMDEYLPDYIDNWIDENRDEDEYIQDFMNSGIGPSEEGVEQYREEFKEQDPTEYENREEDGWDFDNWARDLINEEYEADYEDFLREIANEDDQLRDDAFNECEGDYSMDDWIGDQWYGMSSFLDDYGFEYYRESGSVEGVADEFFKGWIQDNSKYNSFPDSGEYGSTNNPNGWAVETDSSINPDEGAAAELISPVYSSPREMLEEAKSLFKYAEDNFGTNNSTGFHVTMSWQGKPRAGSQGTEPNKLKMALLLGDEYLLDQFGRLRNTYTKSQYQNILKQAERMKKGSSESFLKLQSELKSGISSDKFSTIHFKGQKDRQGDAGNELIEFRIAGGRDYTEDYKKIVKAVVRYATIMKAGYDDDAFRKDYINALYRVIRKASEVDPKTVSQFDELNSPVTDAAKEIVSKKEYFEVLKSLENAMASFNTYKTLSSPEADENWKQSIEYFRKGTGKDPSWMGEAINEEEITGYIEPEALPPSKVAPEHLEKAKRSFAHACVLLANDIAQGTARATPKSKHISAFRKMAKELGFDKTSLEQELLQQIDDVNIEGSDKEKIVTLKQGIEELFKQELIGSPEFFNSQDFDMIADGLWQFFQTVDAKDNVKLDELAELIQKVNPKIDKVDIIKDLKAISHRRQKNELYRDLKQGSYSGATNGFFKTGMVSNQDAVEKLKTFLQAYQGYEHPTSRDHHTNMRSDDEYASVYQMNLVQKLRGRLDFIKELSQADPEKADKIKKDLIKIGIEFLTALKPDEELNKESYDLQDGSDYLASDRRLEAWNSKLDRLVRLESEIGSDDVTYNFLPSYNDYVIGSIHLDRYFERKKRYGLPDPSLRPLVKERFDAIKKFLSAFNKIFKAEGFSDLAQEIKGKRTLDRRNKDFEKNVRNKALATLNIPSHSFAYIKKDFYTNNIDDNYGDDEDVNQRVIMRAVDVNDGLNNHGDIYVIPSAHWSQADDAYNGLDLIKSMEKADNYYHSWRKAGYKKILSKFISKYQIPFKDLVYGENYYSFMNIDNIYNKFNKKGIEITRAGDSRAGAPGQDYLVDPEVLKNPISDEPIDRGSAMMWNQMDDEEKEMKRFNAFDFSVYPKPMKGLVAKELKDMKEKEGYYSLKVALDNVLKKIVDGEIKLALNRIDNVDGMAQAAGVEDYVSGSSNEVSGATNWSNLSDYLGIERGVNDQGPNLLKKVYDMFDSNHNWRPESDPDAIGIQRWAAAVKAAYEYIQKNYKVSAGNYFRKDAEGNAGDDVSNIYGNDQSGFDVTTDDYEKVREKYRMFNAMMQNGIQLYILQPDVNRLVSFLSNEDNDELFKQAVLNRLIRDQESSQEPNDFQGALARARMDLQNNNIRYQESVFAKFDKLPLQESLDIIFEVDKKKIDVIHGRVNPVAKHSRNKSGAGAHIDKKKQMKKGVVKHKGKNLDENMDYDQFKRNHPPYPNARRYSKYNNVEYVFLNPNRWPHTKSVNAKALGFKVAKNGEYYMTISKYIKTMPMLESKLNESVPDNRKLRTINKLLAGNFPASDLRKQMDAYFAIPDPEMLYDFRRVRAEQGDKACLRSVFRKYVKSQIPANLHSQINMNESLTLKEGVRYAVQVGDQRIIHVKSPKEAKEFIKFLKGKGIKKDMKVVPMNIPNKYESVQLDETPQEMVSTALKISKADRLIRYIDGLSKNAKCVSSTEISTRCKQLDARKQKLQQALEVLNDQLNKQAEETYQQGVYDGEQGFVQFKKKVTSLLRQLATKINGKVEFLVVADDYSEAEVPTTNPHTGKPLNLKDKKKAQTEAQAIESLINVLEKYFSDPRYEEGEGDPVLQDRDNVIEFLDDAANGRILRMEDVIAVGTDPDRQSIESLEDIVRMTAEKNGKQKHFAFYQKLVEQGIMKQTAENTTSGNVGPGELALLLLCAPAEKGERGDLLVDGKEVEIKSGSYGTDSEGKSTTGAGGKFNSKFIVKGKTAGSNLERTLTSTFNEFGVNFKDTFTEYMAKNDNVISLYKFNKSKFNLPTISSTQFDLVWNPYFESLNLQNSQVKAIAEAFAYCTFERSTEAKAHLKKVFKEMDKAFGTKNVANVMLDRSVKGNKILGDELRKMLISLQFTSYQFSSEGNEQLHDMILYMNKLKSTITTVSNVKDLMNKFEAGQVVAVKDINLTDTQQTAAHSITAGLPLDEV